MLLKGILTICTQCHERCIISSQDPSCSKWKDRLWLDRGTILCRFCKDITQCAQCARDITRFGYGMQKDSDVAKKLFDNFLARKEVRIS